jgi:hypothetical protein
VYDGFERLREGGVVGEFVQRFGTVFVYPERHGQQSLVRAAMETRFERDRLGLKELETRT